MFYKNYFTRIEDSNDFRSEPYKRRIATNLDNEKAKNLFQDCFSNHVDFDNPFIESLTYDESLNATRYIQRDILSGYFINELYEPPIILRYEKNVEISYDDFINNLTENSQVENKSTNYSLGSNRLRFLVGDVGEGKSALVKKIISTICKDEVDSTREKNKNRIISIYMNFEDIYNYSDKPSPLKNDFYQRLYQTIQEKIENIVDISDITVTSNIANSPELVLKRLFNILMKEKIQLILFLDNIDFYHYYSAKYSYFSEYYDNQNEMINENIMWLYSLFSKKSKLGDQGLNILFSVRGYVYDDIVSNTNGTDTEIDTTKAYKIKLVDEDIVLGSRLILLKTAIDIVSIKHKKIAEDFIEIYNILKIVMDTKRYGMDIREEKLTKSFIIDENKINKVKVNKNSPIKQISKIGQHGYRSLVQFFSSLHITYLGIELIDRFFRKQASTLRLLYFTETYKKYTQANNHFPNLFLNDCTVSNNKDFPLAHQGHAHTYWLKYFVLKYIVLKKKVRFLEIMDIFHTIGKYDEHLIKHVVGSLGTANEFRCIEYDTSEPCNINNRKLSATERGKYFYESTSSRVEHCFDIEYLQIAVEDKWLCVPNSVIDDIYDSSLDYGYLYLTGSEYINKSIDSVVKKSKSCLIFLDVLQDSYDIEIKENKNDLHALFVKENLLPDLKEASKKIIISTEGVIKSFKREKDMHNVDTLRKQFELLGKNIYYTQLRDYYANIIDTKKVR